MDKQQIAHILEKEIKSVNTVLCRLDSAYHSSIDDYQAINIANAMKELNCHKQKLESVIENIVEDAKGFNSTFNK